MMGKLSCVYCLRKIQTRYEETEEGYRPLSQRVDLEKILEPYFDRSNRWGLPSK